MEVLVIAPHHDDEVLGCGGSIYLHTQKGDNVYVVFITAGWSGIPAMSKEEAILEIREESKNACSVLGAKNLIELGFPDRNFSCREVLPKIVKVLRELAPDLIYIPHSKDGDREHRLVHKVARESIWLASSGYLPNLGAKIYPLKMVLGYEVWKPMSSFQICRDITEVISQKREALSKYQSQMAGRNWVNGITGLNQFRGITSMAVEYAEVFQVIKLSSDFL